jgi:cell division topological specificity factor
MNLLSYLSYLRSQKKSSAAVAKERLQIIVARERAQRDGPDYLPMLKDELLNVIRKYVRVNQDAVKIQLEKEGDYEVLELNITLLPVQTA